MAGAGGGGSPAPRARVLGPAEGRAGPAGAALRGLLAAHGRAGCADGERAGGGGVEAGAGRVVLELEGVEVGGVEELRELEEEGYLGRMLRSAAFGRGFLRGGGGASGAGGPSPSPGSPAREPISASPASQLSPVRSPGAIPVLPVARDVGDSLSSAEVLRGGQAGAVSAALLSPPSTRVQTSPRLDALHGHSAATGAAARARVARAAAAGELMSPLEATSPAIRPRHRWYPQPVSVSLDTGVNPGPSKSREPWRQLDMRPSQEELFMRTFAGAKGIAEEGEVVLSSAQQGRISSGEDAGEGRYMRLLGDIESSLDSLFDLEKPANWPLDAELEETLAALDSSPLKSLRQELEQVELDASLACDGTGAEVERQSPETRAAAVREATDFLGSEAAAALGLPPPSPMRRRRQLGPTVSEEDLRQWMWEPTDSLLTYDDESVLLPKPPRLATKRGFWSPAAPRGDPVPTPAATGPAEPGSPVAYFANAREGRSRGKVCRADATNFRPRRGLGAVPWRAVGKLVRVAVSLSVGLAVAFWVEGRARPTKKPVAPRGAVRRRVSTGSRERRHGTKGKRGVAHYTVAEGECLWSISRDVLSDPRNWRSLYHALAAKGLLEDPRDLEPGMELAPALADLKALMRQKGGPSPAGGSGSPVLVRVAPGDTLKSISNLVYGDEELWGRIAESNQVPLHEDGAGALRLGQVLEIP